MFGNGLHQLHSRFGIALIRSHFLDQSLATKINVRAMSSKFGKPARIQDERENVWVEFNRLTAQYKPVNLGQGFPDFSPPEYVTEALATIATQKENVFLHQYTRSFGHLRLVNIISKIFGKLVGKEINPLQEVLVSSGAYEALYCAILGHVDKGDEVIIVEPYFDCYEPMVKMAGGTPVFIPLHPTKPGQVMSSSDWVLDPDELASKFNKKTKAIIINTPHNPIGKIFKRSELEVIANLAKKWDTLVISDEVYEWMVYTGNEHVRIATLPEMWDRTITIGSSGKTFSVTGWKLGWAYGPQHLVSNMQAIHQNCVYTCPTPLQEAVAIGFELESQRLDKPESYFNELPKILEKKRDKMAAFLTEAGLNPVIPEGGYFMLADYSSLAKKINLDTTSNKPLDYLFSLWLLKEQKLAVIPPSAFYSPDHSHLAKDYMRLCFIKEDSTLEKAEKIVAQLKNIK